MNMKTASKQVATTRPLKACSAHDFATNGREEQIMSAKDLK